MTIGIAPARADHRHAWPELLDEGVRRGRAAAVMRDLQHVQPVGAIEGQSLGQELSIDLLLHVAGEQQASLAKTHIEHERDVRQVV